MGGNGRPVAVVAWLAALSLLAACSRPPEPLRLEGPTMGTRYHVTVVPGADTPPAVELQAEVDAVLREVDASMSTWRADSELSRLNATPAGEWVELSEPLFEVLSRSLHFHEVSGGSFDVTVGPVLRAWGFGPGSEGPRVPADAELEGLADAVGSAAIELASGPPRVRKNQPREIELAAIAPGYAVDRVAAAFTRRGLGDFMIEIGGEVRTSGRNARGEAWRIGIEQPDAPPGTPALAVRVSGQSVSTSGDYRAFFESGGVRYSHTIDPATRRPVAHGLASVTVVAADCLSADAWSTALMVLGPEAGLALAEREGLAAHMIVRDGAGGFATRSSTAFAAYLDGQAAGGG